MKLHKNMWHEIKVPRGTPLIVTDKILDSCRSSITKNAYTHMLELPCNDHDDCIGAMSWCSACKTQVITETSQNKFDRCIEYARRTCDQHYDTWVVDGDTSEIVAAFRANIERLI